ncbi:hypothetical protein DMN91_007326 [Ooceraea biroi]|uniref:Uncharacterized protein n=1 Tax=Ooceraea biroi TaxID=2015173 RepID=A0A3L8DKJ9_OOCBI|nr:hypothetical protein DMN91_007326 [Ooceraea biroi]
MVLQTLDELSIEEDFDAVQILDITMELPVANENLLPDPSREDLHLLPEDVESRMMQIILLFLRFHNIYMLTLFLRFQYAWFNDLF